MKEVVQTEILKLLKAWIIFSISDSEWVSPVQVVPKKGGMTVVKKDNNELISTRTITGWRVCIDYMKLNIATRKDHFPLPFIDQMLDRLAGTLIIVSLTDMVEDIMEEKKLVLNWEKCHFMVQEGIVVGHHVSAKWLEVDRAKIDTIAKLPPPPPMSKAFGVSWVTLDSTGDCLKEFETIKEKLVTAPVMVVPAWDQLFEVMYNASDYVVGTVSGQRRDKVFRAIHYASKTFNGAQLNYTTIEKEMLAEFGVEIRDKKGSESVVADHLSRLENEKKITTGLDLLSKEEIPTRYQTCDRCQHTENISRHHELPLTNVLEVELFDVWGIDFMGSFSPNFGQEYRAYWAMKKLNLDMKLAGPQRLLQLNKLEEF
ncbi:uncharacterized protein LOC111366959 [Olea europaea var. sylvestris]|uniref:uncharacterized protein LOC111366959 n=1 Tax=Olea europaea var. sylvestris TaxID=158386 RepID=UPI000C1D1EEC|nr:uncharacterized protein LOC111366959 [Olea europaea var. sylvestris]